MIYTVTLNPALDKTVVIPDFSVNKVNRIQSLRTDVGGKGINVSKCISVLNEKSTALVLLGGATGEKIKSFLEQEPNTEPLDIWTTQGETRTNLKVVDPSLCSNTDINEPGPMADGNILTAARDKLLSHLQPGDIVVFSGSLPKGVEPSLYREWGILCREKGAYVFLDADSKALALGLESQPFLVKPNREELSGLFGENLADDAALVQAGRALISRGVKRVVISTGGEGALFISEEDSFRVIAPKVQVQSTVGAGDSMVAALAYGTYKNLPWREQAKLAVAFGSASVACAGTQSPALETIQELLKQVQIAEIAS